VKRQAISGEATMEMAINDEPRTRAMAQITAARLRNFIRGASSVEKYGGYFLPSGITTLMAAGIRSHAACKLRYRNAVNVADKLSLRCVRNDNQELAA
jgi:hypothetical protein